MTTETDLTADDFAEFFRSVHGYEPYQWQKDLSTEVIESGTWPALIDLPTGSGKTSVLDIAVFALAVDAQNPPTRRKAPIRIVLVVDRRIVVDQVGERARKIVVAMNEAAPNTVLVRVKLALESLSKGGPALLDTVLRGGTVRDESWAQRPDVPALISSTVDQIGSRLLFRGYGLSPSIAPIHAGLLASDTLIFLDEVHLSQPFAQTLERLAELRRASGLVAQASWQVVELSATPQVAEKRRFPAEALTSDTVGVDLGRRLAARKPATLLAIDLPKKDWAKADIKFSARVSKEAKLLLNGDACDVLGVVVNRVDTARRIAAEIDSDDGPEVVLLTGRMRPLDRDKTLSEIGPLLEDRDKRMVGTKIVVVATQCIEAGADFDFDGLITECASIDALKQRFGRVDRAGVMTSSGTPTNSLIVSRGKSVDPDDPIYGAALARTWEWLCSLPTIDFGIEFLDSAPADCVSNKASAPYLSSRHLRSFAQTSPAPVPDHIPARWLHGDTESLPGVQVLWRAELSDLLADSGDETEESRSAIERRATERLAFNPPMSLESIEIPTWAARRWLAGEESSPLSDIDGGGEIEQVEDGVWSEPKPFLVWANGEAKLVDPAKLWPGSTVVLAPEFGGLRDRNWDPTAIERVDDLSLKAAQQARGRTVVMLTASSKNDVNESIFGELNRIAQQGRNLPTAEDCGQTLETSEAHDHTWQGLKRQGFRHISAFKDELANAGEIELDFVAMAWRTDSEDDERLGQSTVAGTAAAQEGASFTGATPLLVEHLAGVGAWAYRLATNIGFPDELATDLRLAGELHDLGKADPRFQAWLRGGISGSSSELLAKSETPSQSWARVQAARRQSGYPSGARHELLSLAMAQSDPKVLEAANDPDLVAHLIASHHGHCRPFAPSVADEKVRTVGLKARLSSLGDVELSADSRAYANHPDSGTCERFWKLVDAYGPHQLAWIEAVFRLADHRRSEQEAREMGR